MIMTRMSSTDAVRVIFQVHRRKAPAGFPKAEGDDGAPDARFSKRKNIRKLKPRMLMKELERKMGIEPTPSAWEAEVLPLNYSRKGQELLYTLCGELSRVFLIKNLSPRD